MSMFTTKTSQESQPRMGLKIKHGFHVGRGIDPAIMWCRIWWTNLRILSLGFLTDQGRRFGIWNFFEVTDQTFLRNVLVNLYSTFEKKAIFNVCWCSGHVDFWTFNN